MLQKVRYGRVIKAPETVLLVQKVFLDVPFTVIIAVIVLASHIPPQSVQVHTVPQ